jgi:methionyl-tRNA formyltransferase
MHMMIRVVFMGSPEFAVPILRELCSHHAVTGVVTQPDRPAGRGKILRQSAVKLAAGELGLEVIQPERLKSPEAIQQLADWSPELIVVAAFGQILRPETLALPTHGCLNVHASLLPRWRGAAPIQAAILAGDAETGVTVMQMDEGLDTGPILAQEAIPIEADDTGDSLSRKLSSLGADLLIASLPAYVAGSLRPQRQDASLATYAPLMKKEDGLLDFAQPAVTLARRVRALRPWPGTFFLWGDARLNVRAAHAVAGSGEIGQRLVLEGQPAMGTGNGLLILDEVQPEGRKPMDARAFLIGARSWAA